MTHFPGSADPTTLGSPDDDLDPAFVFAFHTYDDLGDDQRWSAWDDLEALMKGPEPRPDWVVTSSGAIDTELGILKTGKEADVFLLERADPLAPGTGVAGVRAAAWASCGGTTGPSVHDPGPSAGTSNV